ncbi:MAG: TetR/AcrR family transcriptional regulator [Cellulosimicrobium cellulans]
MPKLWSETIEAHRDAVREAVLDAAADLVVGRGVAGVSMSAIAQGAGIGRATLYKYFPDVESILLAWHERQIQAHLTLLIDIRNQTQGVRDRLEAVLRAYAFLSRAGHCDAVAVRLHQGVHASRAQQHLRGFLAELVQEGVKEDVFRSDVAPEELAAFCLHALAAADGMTSDESVLKLVGVTLDALNSTQIPDAQQRTPNPPTHSAEHG